MKRPIIILCSVVILLCAALGIYCSVVLAPLADRTFTVQPLMTVYNFAAKQVFWLCLGVVLTLALLKSAPKKTARTVCLIAALAAVLVYGVLAAVYFGASVPALSRVMQWFYLFAPVFLAPGALLGIGISGLH